MQARLVWLVLWCAGVAHAARILAVFPTNTKSHYAMYGRLIGALAKRDHNLTVITHFPMKNPPPNLIELSLAGTIPEIVNNLTVEHNAHYIKPSFIHNIEQIMKECVDACNIISQKPAVKALLQSNAKFDLIIVEVFGSDCFLPLSTRFKAPIVGLLSSVPLPWVNEQLGNPEGTSYIPAYMMSYGQRMSTWERFSNTIAVLWTKIVYKYKSQIPSQTIADRLFGPGPKLEQLARNYSLILSNSHFSINEVRPLVPSLVEVGGLHLNNDQILKQDLKQLLDNAPEGVIYWSFGSMSRIETIPRQTLEQIFNAISDLPYTFLTKMNRDLLPKNLTVPDNMQTMEWIPQYKTLCHPNVRLFICHGGLLGTQEAVACGVPMLTVPLYADQALNGRAMSDRGVARTISIQESTAEMWRATLNDLLQNPSYKQNAVKLRDKFLDRPLPPLETGIYWIEYVLRHQGASHLRTPALDLSYTQYLLLDVIGLSLVIASMTIYILYKLFRYLSTRCIRWGPKEVNLEKKMFKRNNSFLHCFFWIYKFKSS